MQKEEAIEKTAQKCATKNKVGVARYSFVFVFFLVKNGVSFRFLLV